MADHVSRVRFAAPRPRCKCGAEPDAVFMEYGVRLVCGVCRTPWTDLKVEPDTARADVEPVEAIKQGAGA